MQVATACSRALQTNMYICIYICVCVIYFFVLFKLHLRSFIPLTTKYFPGELKPPTSCPFWFESSPGNTSRSCALRESWPMTSRKMRTGSLSLPSALAMIALACPSLRALHRVFLTMEGCTEQYQNMSWAVLAFAELPREGTGTQAAELWSFGRLHSWILTSFLFNVTIPRGKFASKSRKKNPATGTWFRHGSQISDLE